MRDSKEQLELLKEAFRKDIAPYQSLSEKNLTLEEAERTQKELNELITKYRGNKSEIKHLKKSIGLLPQEERKEFGDAVFNFDREMEHEFFGSGGRDEGGALSFLLAYIAILKAESERLDVTLPGTRPRTGHLHPMTLLRQKIEDIFVSMGYAIEDDREIETDYYNFDALNIPEGHPARESQDTFYTTDGFALRSQTSTVQIRAMERRGVPIRIIAPGKVFRRDTPDMTHTPMFHQLEGLCVDKGITMAHLKGTVTEWLRRLFGEGHQNAFSPELLPFHRAERGIRLLVFQMSRVRASSKANAAARVKARAGSSLAAREWCIRMCCAPAMSTRRVYSGFAFGFGLERMAALMYSLDDIRHMFENDVRFLEQFK